MAKLFSGISKGITSQAENKALDHAGQKSPAHRRGEELAGRTSSTSTSTSTKKHVIFLDKKVSSVDCPNITIEECSSPYNSEGTIETFENPAFDMDAVENLRDVTKQNDSPVLTIVDPERLIFRKPLGAYSNKGFELTVETVRNDRLFMGKRQSSAFGLVHSYSSSLVEARNRQIEHRFSVNATSESVIESDSESKLIKRYSFKNNLTDFNISDDTMDHT